jgi:diguanylate cyclase (GGDEF)-like protein
VGWVNESIQNRKAVICEKDIPINGEQCYFSIQTSALFTKEYHVGTIILFKDITQKMAYIRALEMKNNQLDKMNTELLVQNEQIARLNDKLKKLAELDALTGTYNRRFFNEYYEIEISRAINFRKFASVQNSTMDFTIAIIDVDNFKSINDRYGHIVGDSALKQIADIMKKVCFSRDILCRYGGEEFAIIFTKTTKEYVIKAAEKIRRQVELNEFSFNPNCQKEYLTISIGIADFKEVLDSPSKTIVELADERLYKAKAMGKNRVVFE